jgi:hypothetical protein
VNVTKITHLKPHELPAEHDKVLEKLFTVYRDLFAHDGYGTLSLEMRFLKKGQKEVLISCGKEYRFVLDYPSSPAQ